MRDIETMIAEAKQADPQRSRIWGCIYHDHYLLSDGIRCACEGEAWGGGTLMTKDEAHDEAELHLGHDCGDGTFVTDYLLDQINSTMHFICVR